MANVLGIGSPIIDYILKVDQSFLNSISGEKGGMVPISHKELQHILQQYGTPPILVAGGSCSNTIKALAHFGHSCSLTGKIGTDSLANAYINSLQQLNVKPLFKPSQLPTAQVICLIDEEGKRTCRSYLGASVEMSPQDLSQKDFEQIHHVHLEGYGLLNEGLTLKSMDYAKKAGATISFDLGSFEVVKTYKKVLEKLISEYVDVLFCNEDECKAFTHLAGDRAFKSLAELCDCVVIMLGKEGSWSSQDRKENYQPAFSVPVLDTTGAGDFFASGFLHGYLQKKSLQQSAWIGTLAASHVIQHYGAEIPLKSWKEIHEMLKKQID